jgi:Na+/proline symporter
VTPVPPDDDREKGRPTRSEEQYAAEARRVQAKTWIVLAVVWIVTATLLIVDGDSSPALRTGFAVIGLCQVAAALFWLRAGRRS